MTSSCGDNSYIIYSLLAGYSTHCGTLNRLDVIMFSVFFIAWIFQVISCGMAANEYQDTTDVLNEITNPKKYSKFLRPYHKGKPLNVTIQITVVHFIAVREMEEEFSLDMIVRQKWVDPRLNHSLNESITLPGELKKLIWLPDTFFLDVRSAIIHDVISENSKVFIRTGGHVTYSTRLTLTSGCAMDLSDYPLDEQSCDLELSTYAFTTNQVDYKWNEGSKDKKIKVEDKQLSDVSLVYRDAIKDFEDLPDGKHSKLIARFWFKRRLGYAFLQIYFPTIMLVVLSWLVFWIPQHSIPARVALGSTTVLSIVTFTGSFRNSLPKVSYVKAVDIYFIVSFVFIFTALMEFVFVLLDTGVKRQRQNNNNDMENDDKGQDRNEVEELQEVKVESPVSKNEKPRRILRGSVKTAKEYVHYAFIQNEASYIDRVSRYLFPCCYLIFNVIYWCYYELASFGHNAPDD